MRLIDAEALIAKQASIAKTFARSDAQKSLIGRVMYNTENAPTIDAIPVQWIENRLNAMLKGTASAESCFAVILLLADWQREQEER